MKKLPQEALFTHNELTFLLQFLRELATAHANEELELSESEYSLLDAIAGKLEYHVEVHESDVGLLKE